MAVSTVSVLHGINWNGSTFISQITNSRTSPGIQEIVTHAAGAPQPMFAGNMKQQPVISFDSTQIKSLLDLTGSGLAASSGNSDLYYRLTTNRGDRVAAATTSHTRLRVAQACMLIERISARDGSEATASGMVYPVFDGTNEPIVPAGSMALAGTPTSAEHFTVGPININGSAIAGVQDVTINLGINLTVLTGDGEMYPTFVGVGSYSPVITARVPTLSWTTLGLNGISDDAVVFLRKVGALTRAANNATTHISFTIASSKISIDDTAAGDNDPAYTTIRIVPISSDGMTAPMVIDTTADIT